MSKKIEVKYMNLNKEQMEYIKNTSEEWHDEQKRWDITAVFDAENLLEKRKGYRKEYIIPFFGRCVRSIREVNRE